MAIFKCKMCGGALEVMDGATTGECQYCGTTQTLPKLNDDKKANMYDRANHFRRNNEFDKARAIYEQILNEDKTDAESYWSIILCQYGIEYVEDPVTHKRVPTVNRAQFTSVLADENYKKAIEHADVYQKSIYEEEAKAIDEIQKGILAISQKEEPFDVFICYKETDNNGRRTPDSVLANDLYHQLTQEGFKVFFSRITLEDKLGSAYEPYIFAALNSAKVMVVVGTKPEYFNAVWVKNEWSRYLSLIKSGANRILIPAYRDMDPYDLPEEFSHLQAQDMSKLGFVQDLIHGIKKILQTEKTKVTIANENIFAGEYTNVTSLLKRVSIFLKDCAWDRAESYCEKVLDIDPENAEAYIYLLLIHLKKSTVDELVDATDAFDMVDHYKKAIRFGESNFVNELIYLNNENYYRRAVKAFNDAKTEEDYLYAKEIFDAILDYKDAKEYSNRCIEQADKSRIEAIYKQGCYEYNKNTLEGYNSTITILNGIVNYKDSDELIKNSNLRINEIIEANQKAKKKRNIIIAICSIILITIYFLWAVSQIKVNKEREEKILNNLIGETMSYSDGYSSGLYRYSSETEYEFFADGTCTCKLTMETDWDDYAESRGTRDSYDVYNFEYDYSVKVSLLGNATVNIGGTSCPLTLDENDHPVSFTKGEDTYY